MILTLLREFEHACSRFSLVRCLLLFPVSTIKNLKATRSVGDCSGWALPQIGGLRVSCFCTPGPRSASAFPTPGASRRVNKPNSSELIGLSYPSCMHMCSPSPRFTAGSGVVLASEVPTFADYAFACVSSTYDFLLPQYSEHASLGDAIQTVTSSFRYVPDCPIQRSGNQCVGPEADTRTRSRPKNNYYRRIAH